MISKTSCQCPWFLSISASMRVMCHRDKADKHSMLALKIRRPLLRQNLLILSWESILLVAHYHSGFRGKP